MTRKLLAIATALLVAPTLLASAAEACISCEIVRERAMGDHAQPTYTREHVYAVERAYIAPAKKRVVRSEPVAKAVETADTADTAPIKTQANNENSSISAAAEVAATETVKVEPKTAQSESSSISLASTEAAAPKKVAETAKEAAAKPVGCKKFFPSVGMTLTVPCE